VKGFEGGQRSFVDQRHAKTKYKNGLRTNRKHFIPMEIKKHVGRWTKCTEKQNDYVDTQTMFTY